MANPGEVIFKINKIDDKRAIKLMKEIASVFGFEESALNFQFMEGLNLTLKEIPEKDFKSGSFQVWQIYWAKQEEAKRHVHANFCRRLDSMGEKSSNPLYDEIKITYSNPDLWRPHISKIQEVQAVLKNIIVPPSVSIEGDSSTILRELIIQNSGTHSDMMDQLNAAVEQMVTKREELEERAAKAEKAREQAHKDALDKLEEERAKLQRQSHMSERRKIASQIGARLADAVENSRKPRGAQTTGWAVFLAALLVGCVGVVSLVLALLAIQARADAAIQIASAIHEYSSLPDHNQNAIDPVTFTFDKATDWYLIIRSVLSSIVAVGAFTYAAAWMKKYYDEDIRLRRELERFNDDIQRASWIVEAVHEVEYEEKGELPPEWVTAVTRNLFDKSSQPHDDDGVAALRALMGFTASASFGPDGPRFDINRRGARRLNQTEAQEE